MAPDPKFGQCEGCVVGCSICNHVQPRQIPGPVRAWRDASVHEDGL